MDAKNAAAVARPVEVIAVADDNDDETMTSAEDAVVPELRTRENL